MISKEQISLKVDKTKKQVYDNEYTIAEMRDKKLTQEKQKCKVMANYSVGFPYFDGSNPQEWLCQAKQFFENYLDDEFAKVRHASFYLTGDADLWFIENFEGKERVTWQHFSRQLLGRFLMIKPIPSGNLPLGFDPSTCRSVFVGNVNMQVTEPLRQEVFASTGPIESCKLIRKEKSSYGFIHYFDLRPAALAILSLNGRLLFGQPIKVNWAYASGQREDSSHYNIFVGDLSTEVIDAMLFTCFSVYPSCSDASVMWDQKPGRSREFGFVSFQNQQEAQSAINNLTGKWLGSRQIHYNCATKGVAGTSDDKHISHAKEDVVIAFTQLLQNADVVSDSPNIENHVANYPQQLEPCQKRL